MDTDVTPTTADVTPHRYFRGFWSSPPYTIIDMQARDVTDPLVASCPTPEAAEAALRLLHDPTTGELP